MSDHLEVVIAQVRTLPEERQREAAARLAEFPALERTGIGLTPEQVAEIERPFGDDEPFASDEDVAALFTRLTK